MRGDRAEYYVADVNGAGARYRDFTCYVREERS